MNYHPGGLEQTKKLLELAGPLKGRWLDMGAGAGETLRLLKSLGLDAVGIDLNPRAPEILEADFTAAPFESGSFQGVISQCAFYCSGKREKAIAEAARLLKKGGKLLLSDVCYNKAELMNNLENGGFKLLCFEDLTPLWREYYLEALWREENVTTGKGCSYFAAVCERI